MSTQHDSWWQGALAPTMARLRNGDDLHAAPYPHVLAENFFSRRLYDLIVRHFPKSHERAWMRNNNTVRCRKAGLCEQWGVGTTERPLSYNFSAPWTRDFWPFGFWDEPVESPRRIFWRGFWRAINSDAMRASLITAFAPTIQARYNSTRAHDVDAWARTFLEHEAVHVDFALRRSGAGYALEPHTDICGKVVSMVLFIPDDDEVKEAKTAVGRRLWTHGYARPSETPYGASGTTVYEPLPTAPLKSSRCGDTKQTFIGYREVKRAPYAHNTMFAFSPCATSWHGVASSTSRRSIFFFLTYPSARPLEKWGHRKKRTGDGKLMSPTNQAACVAPPERRGAT